MGEKPARAAISGKRFWRRGRFWTWFLAAFAALFALALLLLPEGIRWGAQKWLRSQGQPNLVVRDLDFNPFIGRLAVHCVVGGQEKSESLALGETAVQLNWWPLRHRRIGIQGVTLQDTVLDIRKDAQGRLSVGGLVFEPSAGKKEKPPAKEPGKSWGFGIGEVNLDNVQVRYSDPKVQVNLGAAYGFIAPMATWNAETPTTFVLSLHLNEGRIFLTGRMMPFASDPSASSSIRVHNLHLDWLNGLLADAGVRNLGGAFSTRAGLMAKYGAKAQTVDLKYAGQVSLENLSGTTADAALQNGSIRWDGVFSASGALSSPTLSARGMLDIAKVQAALTSPSLSLAQSELSWKGDFTMKAGGQQGISLAGDLLARGLSADDHKGSAPLAQVESVQLQGARMSITGGTENRLLKAAASLRIGPASARIDGPMLQVSQAGFGWDGEVEYALNGSGKLQVSAGASAKGLAVDGMKQGMPLGRLQKMELRQGRLSMSKEQEGQKIIASGDLAFSGAEVNLAEQGIEANLDSLQLDTAAVDLSGGSIKSTLEKLGLKNAEFRHRAQDMDAIIGDLQIGRVAFDLATSSGQKSASLRSSVGDLRLDSGRVHLARQDMQAELGQLQIQVPDFRQEGAGENQNLALDCALRAKGLRARLKSQGYDIRQEELRWKGNTNLGPGEPRSLLLSGDLAGKGLSIQDLKKKLALAGMDRFDFRGVSLKGPEQVSANAIHLQGIRAFEQSSSSAGEQEHSQLVVLDQLKLDKLQYRPEGLEARLVSLAGLDALLALNPNGQLRMLESLPGGDGGSTTSTVPAKASQKPNVEQAKSAGDVTAAQETTDIKTDKEKAVFALRLDRIELVGENRLVFMDEGINPPVRVTVAPLSLSVAELNTAEPSRMSPLSFQAGVDQYANIAIQGALAPFMEIPSADLQGSITAINLPPLSSYAERAIGYRMRRGAISADLRIRLDESGALDSACKILLSKLELDRLKAEELDDVANQLGLPVNTALALLRDRNDDIVLNIPVAGNLKDPKVRIGAIIRKAIFGGVSVGVRSVLSPLGISFETGKKLVGRGNALGLKPAEFLPGQTEMVDGAAKYLDKLADTLKDRPQIRLTLEGVVNGADVQALRLGPGEAGRLADNAKSKKTRKWMFWKRKPAPEPVPEEAGPPIPREKLQALANDRAGVVKGHLVTRGVEPDRLLTTTPRIEESAEEPPRVEISL